MYTMSHNVLYIYICTEVQGNRSMICIYIYIYIQYIYIYAYGSGCMFVDLIHFVPTYRFTMRYTLYFSLSVALPSGLADTNEKPGATVGGRVSNTLDLRLLFEHGVPLNWSVMIIAFCRRLGVDPIFRHTQAFSCTLSGDRRTNG